MVDDGSTDRTAEVARAAPGPGHGARAGRGGPGPSAQPRGGRFGRTGARVLRRRRLPHPRVAGGRAGGRRARRAGPGPRAARPRHRAGPLRPQHLGHLRRRPVGDGQPVLHPGAVRPRGRLRGVDPARPRQGAVRGRLVRLAGGARWGDPRVRARRPRPPRGLPPRARRLRGRARAARVLPRGGGQDARAARPLLLRALLPQPPRGGVRPGAGRRTGGAGAARRRCPCWRPPRTWPLCGGPGARRWWTWPRTRSASPRWCGGASATARRCSRTRRAGASTSPRPASGPRPGPPWAPSPAPRGSAVASSIWRSISPEGVPVPWMSGSTSRPETSIRRCTTSSTGTGSPQPAFQARPKLAGSSSEAATAR